MGRSLFVLAVVLVGCQDPLPHLSETAQHTIVLPGNTDFGSVQVGMSSAQTLVIGPASGEQDDTITAITSSCPDFTITAPGLPADVFTRCTGSVGGDGYGGDGYGCTGFDTQTYSFTATFQPTIAQHTSCPIYITIDAVQTTIVLTGIGVEPPVVLTVTPATVAFGDTRVGVPSSSLGVQVANLGSGAMAVASVAVDPPNIFTIASGTTGQHTVGSNQSETDQVTCTPTAPGPVTGTFTVTLADTTTATTQLTCNGIMSNLELGPSAIQFPPALRVGDTATQDIQLSNAGTAGLTIDAVELSGSPDVTITHAPATGTVLDTSSALTVSLSYTPTAPAAGGAIATLEIDYEDATPQSRVAQISGTALATSMSISVPPMASVCAGSTGMVPVQIVANQPGSFQVTSVSAVALPFAVVDATTPFLVEGDGANHMDFMVTFAPTAEGADAATIMVGTDIPNNAPAQIHIDAQALSSGVTAEPPVVNFGVPPVETAATQAVRLTNCANDAVTITSATIVDDHDDEFAIANAPMSIDAMGADEIDVAMTPRVNGVKLATLVIGYTAGTTTDTLTVPLAGTTLGGTEPAGPAIGDATYYSCSTGGARRARYPSDRACAQCATASSRARAQPARCCRLT